jgi:aquaporin Z
MRRGRDGRGSSQCRYRICRRRVGLRVDRTDHGVRHRPHFRMSSESGDQCGVGSGQALASELLPYAIAQLAGAIAASGVLYVIASGTATFDVHAGFATNGYGANSPGGYTLLAGFVAEVVLTAFFLMVIMGATDGRAPKGFAPIAIGLCLTLIHLIGIPVTNVSVNPARSTGPAIFAGGAALQQLWMFWVAPLIGGALGGGIYNMLFGE